MTIKSGLFILCFEYPKDKLEELRFKVGYSTNIDLSLIHI